MDQLLRLLRDRTTREEIGSLRTRILASAEAILEEPHINLIASDQGRLATPEDLAEDPAVLSQWENVFSTLVVDKLDRPQIYTAFDLVECFADCRTCSEQEFEKKYDDAIQAISRANPLIRRSEPTVAGAVDPTYLGLYSLICELGGKPDERTIELWTSKSGLAVSIVGFLPARFMPGRDNYWEHAVYISVEGRHCTPAALDMATSELSKVIDCLIRSFMLLEQLKFRSNYAKTKTQPNTPEVESGRGFTFVQESLDTFFMAPSKKDSIGRRIGNSIRLIVEADQQRRTAVGLALCVAAAEALLCSKGDDLANMFRENVATLLEPDPAHRPAAVRFANRLYKLRSEVFHGSGMGCSIEDTKAARLLASAVLKGILERRRFQRMAGNEDETPNQLLEEMKNDKYTPGQTTGVEESPIFVLWRASE